MRTVCLFALAVLVCVPAVSRAQDGCTGFLDREVVVDGVARPYQVYVPRDYDASRAWPVILFLHGSGEKGQDGLLPTEVGLGTAIRRHPERYPALVVFPQTPQIWQELGSRIALAALDRTLAEFHTDSTRVILTGLSMGGNGAWYLAYHYPERFAAVAVVCGFVSERRDGLYPAVVSGPDRFAAVAKRLAGLPVWILHGGDDDVVPVEESRRMAAALREAGADVRYTEFPGVNHGAWEPAYAMEDLPRWMLARRRPAGRR